MSYQENVAMGSTTKPERGALGSSSTDQHLATTVDHCQLTVEGFRSLSIMATFFAGIQAQMLSASLSENSTIAAKLVNAFWLAGLFLDVTGAVQAAITARWFELLDTKEAETFNQEWSTNWKSPFHSKPRRPFSSFGDTIIATALFSGLPIVTCGVGMFLIGLVIYVWARQPILVSIISTIPFVILSPLVVACFYPHSGRKIDIVKLLARKRGPW
ncbi:hypothetical protein BYT27DRAFT_7227976 [Phlegmacium glaucopus]|nr:hypothetical protein BYT27DRAFT_7227976 [Phlegmacium glaucopus]